MKKGTIIALIVAFVLILTGGMILVLGLSFADDGTRESLLVAQEVTLTESFDSILIDTGACDVNFVPYNGTVDSKVVIREREETRHTVTVEDGTLKIKMQDNRNWTDYIGIFDMDWENMEITLYLPQKQYASLRITTDTGDIKIPAALSGKEILLHSDTGEIRCEGAAGDLLSCMTNTGDIRAYGCEPVMLKLESDTGDIQLTDTESTEIHLRNDTGETELENVICKILTCESDTGDTSLEWVKAEEYLQVFTNTGDVEIEESDAGSVNIETNTGDVEGHFLTPKWFQAHSNTGNVKVPNTRDGGECRIESDTGDIHFE